MSAARVRESIEAYVAAWNEPEAAARRRLIERSCAVDLRLWTGGRRVEGRAALDAMIAEFQTRRPGSRAVFASAIDVQGHLFRYAGRVEDASGAPGGEALDTGESDEEGRIRLLLTFVGAGLPA
jgi:plasmid stabilization system protein ParE